MLKPKHWPAAHLRQLLLPVLLIVAALVGLDQYSKYDMQDKLLFFADQKDDEIFQSRKDVLLSIGEKKAKPDFSEFHFAINFKYWRNKGAAFSMFSHMPAKFRAPFFNVISLVALIIIVSLFISSPAAAWLLRLGMVLIFAGAVGNFLDRNILGYVIDFIDVEWHAFGFKHDFAVFNIADVAINVGVLLFVIDIMREWWRSVQKERRSEVPTS